MPERLILPADRGARGSHYTLLTPANRYVSHTPAMPAARYYKLVTPRLAPSRIGQYLICVDDAPLRAEFDDDYERFFFGLEGEARVEFGRERADLTDGGYLYLGPDQRFTITLEPGAAVIVIKRRYEDVGELPRPAPVAGRLADVPATPTAVAGLNRRELLDPADPAFDFNISHMEFDPGVALEQIEIHDEEHGLYMTSGGGLYHLDGDEHEVAAHDFIYMAPYCPQGFRAGPDGGSYLLYKDVFRDGF